MRITYARHWAIIGLAAVVALPGPILRVLDITGGPHPDFSPIVQSLIFGLGILAAATLLIWASEVAETEVSATLALVTLALVAVLPEYAVDLFFAWTAPNVPECIRLDFPLDCAGGVSDIVHPRNLAIANMTGANRLLVGLAWPMIFLIFFLRHRRTHYAHRAPQLSGDPLPGRRHPVQLLHPHPWPPLAHRYGRDVHDLRHLYVSRLADAAGGGGGSSSARRQPSAHCRSYVAG